MKKHIKSTAGVTLLEIMLVLAIASMVIVMSIRYYQNATNANNTNAILSEIQNITAAADGLAQGTGTYSAASNASVATVAGSTNMVTPYGAASTISIGTASGSTYAVTVSAIPISVCISLSAKLKSNTKFTSPTCAAKSGTGNTSLTYTYNASS